ncbi:MAG: sulfotransferase [Rhodothalassiaceae bacterium]
MVSHRKILRRLLNQDLNRKDPEPPPLPELSTAPDIQSGRLCFVTGLHRSGTSIVHRRLRAHPDVSGFADTGVPEDEGQFLQSIFKPAWHHGGPGKFAFDPAANLTEQDAAALSEDQRDRLLRQWGYHWDLSRSILVEKSPPSLVRARFLQHLFPDCRFIFLVRHPVAVSLATEKWSKSTLCELLVHWAAAHARFLADVNKIRNYLIIRYEDLCRAPEQVQSAICRLLGLETVAAEEPLADHNQKYFGGWEGHDARPWILENVAITGALSHVAHCFGYDLTAPYVRPPKDDRVFHPHAQTQQPPLDPMAEDHGDAAGAA